MRRSAIVVLILVLGIFSTSAFADVRVGKYSVSEGDTLSAVAKKLGNSLELIMRLNPQLEDPDKIYPGMILEYAKEDGPYVVHRDSGASHRFSNSYPEASTYFSNGGIEVHVGGQGHYDRW